jgi:hypothetical protein
MLAARYGMVSMLLKDSWMVDDIAGVAVVLLTRFTSRVPVSSQRSTVTTYCAKSIELGQTLASDFRVRPILPILT